jgi:hypothetical protein
MNFTKFLYSKIAKNNINEKKAIFWNFFIKSLKSITKKHKKKFPKIFSRKIEFEFQQNKTKNF